MWAFKTLWDKGLIYEGFRVLAYCWRCETPLSATPRPGWTTSTATARTRRSRWGSSSTTGERMLAWTTTPWTLPSNLALAVGPDIDYAVVETPTARATSSPRRGSTPTPRELGDGHPRRHGQGRRARRPPLHAAVRLLRRHGRTERVPGARRRLRRRPRTAPASSTWRPASARTTRSSATPPASRRSCPMDEHGRFTAEVAAVGRRARLRRQPARHPRPQGRGRRRCATRPTTTPTRTAGAATQPLVYRAISSWFVEVTDVPRPDGRAQPADHLGARARQGRQLRQVAGQRPRLVDQPQPLLGLADPGVAERRPGVPAHRRVRLARRARGRLRRDGRPTCTGPIVDELVRPNPDDPTGRSTMRRVPEVLDCWFESGSMPFAQVHYPFENPSGSSTTTRATSSSSTSARPAAGSTRCTCWPRRCSTGRRSATCVSHGIVLGDDGQKMSKSLSNYPDPMEMFDAHGADAMRWYLLSSPILRGNDFSVTEAGIRDTVRQVLLPLWNAWYFLDAVRQRRRTTAARVRTDSTNVLDRYILAKTRAARRRRHRDDGRLRPVRRLRSTVRVVPRRADQLVHPPQPRPVLGRATTTRSTRCTPCSTSLVPGRRAAAAARRRGRSTTACTPATATAQRAPHRLADRRRAARRRRPGRRRWTRSATCARRRCRCARPTAAGSACRWRR